MQPACHRTWHRYCSGTASLHQLGINMSDFVSRGRAATALVFLALGACSAQNAEPPQSLEPVATLQELMQAEVDASADNIWDAVETTAGAAGEEHKQPHTDAEWQEVRRNAIVLIEAANLLTVEGRKLSAAPFPAE